MRPFDVFVRGAAAWAAFTALATACAATPPPETLSAGSPPPPPAAEATATPPTDSPLAGGLKPCPKDAPPGESCSAAPAKEAAAATPDDDTTVWRVPVTRDDPARGPADALVTLVVFSDFECPFCKKETAVYDRVLADHPTDVRLIWKDCPLPMHVYGEPAAEFARSARARGGDVAFWHAHDLLYASQDKLGDEMFRKLAAELRLPWAATQADLKAARYGSIIREDVALSDRVDVRATPTTFVNGKKLVGAQPYDRLKALVDTELAGARELAATSPRNALYARIVANGKEVPVSGDGPVP
jgi:protein-disulfide isomerase